MKLYVAPLAQTTQQASRISAFVLELDGRVFILAFRELILKGL